MPNLDFEKVIRDLYERHPILSRLKITQTGDNAIAERLPPFLGFMLAAMENPPDHPLCFVLPKCRDIGRLAVVLCALRRFVKKHAQPTCDFSKANFVQGDRVRVRPGRHVFLFERFEENSANPIWLKTLDGTGERNLPAESIRRLERTDSTWPAGKLDTPLLFPPRAPLDVLLNTSTFGNLGLLQNEVVLLDSQSGFASFIDAVNFQRIPPADKIPPLKALLPFGGISPPHSSGQSWLKKWDERNTAGEPLVAITHSADDLANFCIDAPRKSKMVVVNNLSRLKKNLQAYRDAADSQRMILFASHDEWEMIEELGRDTPSCQFWWMQEAELALGQSAGSGYETASLFGKAIKWARNFEQMEIESISCEDNSLEPAYLLLERLRASFRGHKNDSLTKLTSLAWRLLNEASAMFHSPTEIEKQQFASEISRLRTVKNSNIFWLDDECSALIDNYASTMEAVLLRDANIGISKGKLLYKTIEESLEKQLSCVLLARNENQIVDVKRWLQQHNMPLDVYSPRTLPDDRFLDRVICISWPGWVSLKQVADTLVSPRISILAYSFEKKWLGQSQRRLQERPAAPAVTASQKWNFVNPAKPNPETWIGDDTKEKPPQASDSTEAGIWHFEQQLRAARKGTAVRPTEASDTVEARYVSFVGDCYAFLTESYKLPVATSLVSGGARTNSKLPECTVPDIKLGDFIVFPESGSREFIQIVADKKIGASAPALRKLARRWKESLQKSGLTPEQFHQYAKGFNKPRHIATIRSWFANNSQIGPREKDDLTLIALVTNDKELDSETDNVRKAIEFLRGAHQSAGSSLRDALLQRLPQVMGQVEENGTKVELGELGSAWIVQIESIAPDNERRGCNEVNQLLREQEAISDLIKSLLL